MEIWCDGACSHSIALLKQGWLTGVTTNPKILSLQNQSAKNQLAQLLEVQSGPVAAQVTAQTSEAMLAQAKKLHAMSERIVVKIPFIPEGIAIIPELVKQKIPSLATAVFSADQFLLASLMKVDYVAPYLNQMTLAGIDAIEEVKLMQAMIAHYGFKTKVMAASIQENHLIKILANLGVASMTLTPARILSWLENKDSLNSTQRLNEAWSQGGLTLAGDLFAS